MKVQLFHTCLVNEIDPEVGMAVVRVLETADIELSITLGVHGPGKVVVVVGP